MKNGGWGGKLWSADPWTWHNYCIYQFSEQLWLLARHLHMSEPIPVLIREGFSKPLARIFRHLVATKGGRTVFLLGDVVTAMLPTPQWMVPYCAQMHSTSWAHVAVNNKDKYDDNEDMRLGERWGSEFWDIEGINGGGVNVIKIHCIQV